MVIDKCYYVCDACSGWKTLFHLIQFCWREGNHKSAFSIKYCKWDSKHIFLLRHIFFLLSHTPMKFIRGDWHSFKFDLFKWIVTVSIKESSTTTYRGGKYVYKNRTNYVPFKSKYEIRMDLCVFNKRLLSHWITFNLLYDVGLKHFTF